MRTPGEYAFGARSGGGFAADRFARPEGDRGEPGAAGRAAVRDLPLGGAGPKACGTAFAEAGFGDLAVNIEGGTLAWEQAGYPVAKEGRAVLPLDRQVRIAIGCIASLGAILGWLVHPVFHGLSAFCGAGLIFAGNHRSLPTRRSSSRSCRGTRRAETPRRARAESVPDGFLKRRTTSEKAEIADDGSTANGEREKGRADAHHQRYDRIRFHVRSP